MSNPRNREQSTRRLTESMFWMLVTVFVVVAWTVVWAGQNLVGNAMSYSPLTVISGLLGRGSVEKFSFNTGGLILTVVLLILLLAALIVPLALRRKRQRHAPGQSVRHATVNLASKDDIAQMSLKAVAKRSEHLNLVLPAGAAPGVLLGRELATKKLVYIDYETLTFDAWAARYGKSTGRITPMILEAPGAVVTTSNKPDVVSDTLDARSAVGSCFVCDPQRLFTAADSAPEFWVDPLDFIRMRAADEWDGAAEDLAILFANDAGIDVGSGGNDEQWRTSGAEMLSCFLLAAAVDSRPITDIVAWIYDPENTGILSILTTRGWAASALKAQGTYKLTSKTRDGVFFSLRNMVNPLTKKVFTNWVTASDQVPKFDPSAFIAAHLAGKCPTLYLLSDKRDASSASLLSLLLTVWVARAAEAAARDHGGRLPTPLLMPLDEVANTVLWQKLPDVYSFYGSKGIIIASVFQSFRQARRNWGADSASDFITNATLIVGGGIKDTEFLKEVSTLLGEHETRRVSHGSNSESMGVSSNEQWSERTTLTPAEIRNLDPHLMIVIPQKNRPMIVEAIPFWDRSYRPEIEAVRARVDAGKQAAAVRLAAETVEERI